MFSQSLRKLRHLKKSPLANPRAFLPYSNQAYFSQWKPNVPKYEMRLNLEDYHMAHPIWDLKDVNNIQTTHHEPKNLSDKAALRLARFTKGFFNMIAGYKPGASNEAVFLRRLTYLETIAAVPGMIGGMVRHINALALMRQDMGWIHHLLEQAENERQHLFTFLQIRKPGLPFRLALFAAQTIHYAWYMAFYLFFPRTAHRFVGYMREESIKVYTDCIKSLDEGKLKEWKNMKASDTSKEYWGLDDNANFRDVLASIRADEAMHREIHHHFADMDPSDPMPAYENLVGYKSNKFESKSPR